MDPNPNPNPYPNQIKMEPVKMKKAADVLGSAHDNLEATPTLTLTRTLTPDPDPGPGFLGLG
jgi:hypothetical protein